MMLPAYLNSIGDTVTCIFGMFEQFVASSASVAFNVNGETANRYSVTEFRYSVDNVSWSGYLPFDNGNVQGISHNPNDPIYFEVRFSRAGADASGTLSVTFASIAYEPDPGATYGRGRFTTSGIYQEIRDFFSAAVLHHALKTTGGNPAYNVFAVHPDQPSDTAKPLIYLYDVQAQEETAYTQKASHLNCSFRIGFKRMSNKDDRFYYQVSECASLFRPSTYSQNTFDIVFKGVAYAGVRFSQFGLADFRIGSLSTRYDPKTQDTWEEFPVHFTLVYPNFVNN